MSDPVQFLTANPQILGANSQPVGQILQQILASRKTDASQTQIPGMQPMQNTAPQAAPAIGGNGMGNLGALSQLFGYPQGTLFGYGGNQPATPQTAQPQTTPQGQSSNFMSALGQMNPQLGAFMSLFG